MFLQSYENLINIFSSINEKSLEKIFKEYSGNDFKNFKQDLSDLLISKISRINFKQQKHIQANKTSSDHKRIPDRNIT